MRRRRDGRGGEEGGILLLRRNARPLLSLHPTSAISGNNNQDLPMMIVTLVNLRVTYESLSLGSEQCLEVKKKIIPILTTYSYAYSSKSSKSSPSSQLLRLHVLGEEGNAALWENMWQSSGITELVIIIIMSSSLSPVYIINDDASNHRHFQYRRHQYVSEYTLPIPPGEGV